MFSLGLAWEEKDKNNEVTEEEEEEGGKIKREKKRGRERKILQISVMQQSQLCASQSDFASSASW